MIHCILIGPQGCGKGTQAEMIVATYGLTHIETGLMIRHRAGQHDQKGETINHLANKKGILLPDGVVLDMIYDELTERHSEKGYLFDGFPRTVHQYEALKELLAQKNETITVAVYLNISDAVAIQRISSRRLCLTCGKGYSSQADKEITVCSCGGTLVKRPDDEPEAITRRLASFHTTTQPIINIMKSDRVLHEVDGEKTISEISADIKAIIDAILERPGYVRV